MSGLPCSPHLTMRILFSLLSLLALGPATFGGHSRGPRTPKPRKPNAERQARAEAKRARKRAARLA